MKLQDKKFFVVIPTYNEADNIKFLIENLLTLYPFLHILVVDDNSPDGTYKIVKEIANEKKNVHLLHRLKEKGRGTAGRDGFIKALELGADYIIEMDADFSHDPIYIEKFIENAAEDTVIIGSRLIKGGKEIGRNIIRTIITFFANLYIRVLLNLPVKDCTSGYRLFPSKILKRIPLGKFKSKGPEIVQELLYHCKKQKARFLEIPIVFRDRRAGKSTFNLKIMFRSLWFVFYLRFFYKL